VHFHVVQLSVGNHLENTLVRWRHMRHTGLLPKASVTLLCVMVRGSNPMTL
jgi:hypothetical protein